jgi:hypothetical protein
MIDSLNYDNTATATVEGFTLTVHTEHDDSGDKPWTREDGHGPVRQMDRDNAKRAGELRLGHMWLYDFAEACRNGWGFLPGTLETGIDETTGMHFAGCRAIDMLCLGDNINAAIAALYAKYRATMTPRRYAACAARADYERLRAWCNDDWYYCGVIVTASRNGIEIGNASLWGIESDAGDYLLKVANDLAPQAIAEARAALTE